MSEFDPALVAQVVKSQPELFATDGLEPDVVEPGVIQAARDFSRAPKHTGKTATADEARCVAAFAMLSAGVSRRKIATRLSMSRHTLAGIERAFEEGGKLAPLKGRIERELQLLLAEATDALRDAIESDKRDIEAAAWVKALATALGISFDKHALATGGATQIVEHKGPDVWAGLAEWWQKVEALGAPTDSQSLGHSLQPKALGDAQPPVLTVEVLPADPIPVPAQVPPPANPPVPPSEGGGGGPRVRGGGASDDYSTGSSNLSQGGNPS